MRAAGDGSNAGILADHRGDLAEAPGSWFLPGPALTAAGILGREPADEICNLYL